MPKETVKTEKAEKTERKQPAAKTKNPVPKKMKAIEKLWAADIRTQEKLQDMTVMEMAQLPQITNDDVRVILDVQKRSRDGTLFEFLCEE